jgi:MFS family permease
LPAGLLVDRLGSKALLLVCLWGASLCMIGMAVSPSLSLFAGCAAGLGLCLSVYHPAGTSWVTHSMPISGRVFAIHGMAGSLGVAGASVIAGSLGALLGWRWAIGTLAVLGLGIGMLVLALPTTPLHEVRSRPGRGRWPGFVLLLVAAAFMGMVYRGVTTFLPKFLGTRFTEGASAGAALGGLLTTLALLAGLVGMYLAGRVVDRGMSTSRAFLLGTLAQAPFLVAVAYAAGPFPFLLIMFFAFFHFFTQPPGNHMVAAFTPPRLRGLGYGIYFFVAFGTGSFGAMLGGWVSERVGLVYTFPALAALLVPAVLAVLALVWWVPRDERADRLTAERNGSSIQVT